MHKMSASLALLLTTTSASANSLNDHPGFVLEAVPGSFFEDVGIGSATQAYDPINDEFVMVFDAQLTGADATCPATRFALGFATSPDGITWTPELSPIVTPTPSTYYGCVVAHPTLLIDSDTGLWHLWFKGYQEADACDDPTNPPSWGCGAPSTFRVGIGHAVSDDGGQTWNISQEPVIQVLLFGYPNVSKIDGQFRMFYSAANPPLSDFRMYGASSSDGITWTTPKPVVSPGFADFARDQLMDISAQCRSDERPFVNWVLGRERSTTGPPLTGKAGLIVGTATNGDDWEFDTDPFIQIDPAADPASQFFHHDAIRFVDEFGEENWAVYRTLEDGGDGKSVIQLAYTWPTEQVSLPKDQVADRVCTSLPPTDTGEDTDAEACPPDGNEQPGDAPVPVTFDPDGLYSTTGITDGKTYVGDVDVFEVQVPPDCTLEATLLFTHSDPAVPDTSGDLDLGLSDGGASFVVLSDSTDDNEFLTATNESSSTVTWWVEVLPFTAACTPYTLDLLLDCPEDTDTGVVDTDDTDADTGDTDADTGDTDTGVVDTDDTGDTDVDTGDTEDTGGTDEEPPDTEPDTADTDAITDTGTGCSCDSSTGGPLSLVWMLGLPLLALRRRRG